MDIYFDDGLAFAKGFFETIKIVNKKPILLSRHLSRINASLDSFDIENRLDEDEIYEFISSNNILDGVLKVIITEKNKILLLRKDLYKNMDKKRAYKIKLSSMLRNSTSHMVYHKSTAYYDNIIEKNNARNEGYDEVIFVNEKGNIAEGAISNIFFVRDNRIYTPPIKDGILNGTMRSYLIDRYGIEEISINEYSIKDYDSCFISNSVFGVIWVESIGDIDFSYNILIDSIKSDLEEIGY